MESRLGNTPEGQKRLIAIYVGLAKDLETQLQRADPEVKRCAGQGFRDVPGAAQRGSHGVERPALGGRNVPQPGFQRGGWPFAGRDAKSYYERSAATFQKILERFELEDSLKTQIRLRRAAALRGMQDFDQAIKSLEQILKEKPLLLSVQVEAARTYQQWGATAGNAARYEQAIMGGQPDPETKRNTVWGWAKIAQTTASYAQFRDTFQDARYNLAVCRYNLAQSQKGAEREQSLKAAELDIGLTHRLYGLGDEERTRQYDALLRLIQQNLGKPVDGIRSLTTGKPKAAAPSSRKRP